MYALKDNSYQSNTVFNVGIYVRISREDENSYSTSESIVNQKEYLSRYVIDQGWNLVDVFEDDGYTGTNFNRPGFQRLLEAIETNKVNLVITKDLSRLGRDYIETGHYLERYFPSKSVRYIALNDGIDTFNNSSNNDMSPFKAVVNDFYSRDISKKVRTTIKTKQHSGQFIGAFAPYGYQKAPDDKNKLIIDPHTAPVVKQIFEMYTSGSGYAHIAHTLNGQGTASPSVYKAQNGNYRNPKARIGLWTPETVRSIIINPTYTGCLTQNKYSIISYKVKKLKATSKKDWVTVKDTHEPIVDKETFDFAQRLSETKNVYAANEPKIKHLLGGLLFCQDCGERMTFTKTQKGEWYAICSSNKRFKSCSRHSYLERDLDRDVLADLKNLVIHSVDQEELRREAQSTVAKRRASAADSIPKAIDKIDRRLSDIKRIIKNLYEDKVRGTLTEQDFIDFSHEYSSERETLTEKRTKLMSLKDSEGKQQSANEEFINVIKNLIELNNLSNGILAKLIKRIEISEDKNITVYYQFKSPHVFHS